MEYDEKDRNVPLVSLIVHRHGTLTGRLSNVVQTKFSLFGLMIRSINIPISENVKHKLSFVHELLDIFHARCNSGEVEQDWRPFGSKCSGPKYKYRVSSMRDDDWIHIPTIHANSKTNNDPKATRVTKVRNPDDNTISVNPSLTDSGGIF